MKSTEILVCLTWLFLYKMVGMTNLSSSGRHFISAHVGKTITLQCFYDKNVKRLYWYKQNVGHKPRLIATFLTADKENTFYDECKDNSRFTLDNENGKILFKVSDLHVSDSATYLCAVGYFFIIEFREAITVSVAGSELSIQALVQQSSSEKIQPGGSVTLSCTVHTGMCDGGHSVYWFKNSQEPHQGIIYTHGNNSDQCERKPDAQTHFCVYNLPLENLDLSHAGIYYCAVASCGHTVFGNGTKLDFNDEVPHHYSVYFWSASSAATTLLSLLLAFSICIINKKNNSSSTDSHATLSQSSKTHAQTFQNEDTLRRSVRETDDTWTECVYSGVAQ